MLCKSAYLYIHACLSISSQASLEMFVNKKPFFYRPAKFMYVAIKTRDKLTTHMRQGDCVKLTTLSAGRKFMKLKVGFMQANILDKIKLKFAPS